MILLVMLMPMCCTDAVFKLRPLWLMLMVMLKRMRKLMLKLLLRLLLRLMLTNEVKRHRSCEASPERCIKSDETLYKR